MIGDQLDIPLKYERFPGYLFTTLNDRQFVIEKSLQFMASAIFLDDTWRMSNYSS